MAEAPRIAIVIPVHNLAHLLPQAIDSALAQEPEPGRLEVVVVDDGSTDGTAHVVERYRGRVRYVPQRHQGLSAARNRGLAETMAPYVTFLDADDRLLPGKLATEARVLDREPSTTIVYSGALYVDASGARLPQRGWSRVEGEVLHHLLLGNLIHPHAALVRRAAVEAVGGFDQTLGAAEDWDLWLRITLAGATWRCTNRPLVEYRVRPDGMHADPARMASNRLRVLDKTFALLGPDSELRRCRAGAYREAHLLSACEFLRLGALADAEQAMQAALRHDPALLTDTRTLRRMCRLLLPLGYRNEDRIVREWARIEPAFVWLARVALPARPAIRRLQATMARRRVALRYRRKRLVAWATAAAGASAT